jgi:hypothetical protein
MTLYYITHTDADGELHQLSGAWQADTAEDAIDQMRLEGGAKDDGQWLAHVVTSDDDVIA